MSLSLIIFEVRIWGTPTVVFSGSQHPCGLCFHPVEADLSPGFFSDQAKSLPGNVKSINPISHTSEIRRAWVRTCEVQGRGKIEARDAEPVWEICHGIIFVRASNFNAQESVILFIKCALCRPAHERERQRVFSCSCANLCIHKNLFLLPCTRPPPLPLAAHLNSSLPFSDDANDPQWLTPTVKPVKH